MSLMLDDEVALGNDNRYKSFIVAIERVLKQFESSPEWPDLIASLARVKKIIESYAQFQLIPKRIILFKRLTECLHPVLPSGVHLKTLEVYETIFRIIERRHLQRDIVLYSCGLFSLLPLSALPVKPVLLNLYELYFLPLGEALNPILTGFLIGLFSSLEEGADYYDRVIVLLDRLVNRIDRFYFYTCIWSSIQLAASARYPAVTFILNHFDKRKNIEDQFHLIGLSVEIMVSAIWTCLHDSEQSLVPRAALDFLLTCLPLHKKQLSQADLLILMSPILHILLKRDMSLTRRIYAWFLGTSAASKEISKQEHDLEDSVDTSSYFIGYTREILIESLRNSLRSISKNTQVNVTETNENDNKQIKPSTWTLTKLIRVLLVLVDKSDVGPEIIESIFMNYLLVVHQQVYQPAKKSEADNVQQENAYSETLKTFHMLLETLEPFFIWEFLTKNFDLILNQQEDQSSVTAGVTLEQLCSIINMLLDISSSDTSTDIQSEHLPEMLYRLIKIMTNNIEKVTPHQTILCIELLLKILKNIIPTDTNPHLSLFCRSNSAEEQLAESNLTDSDTEDEKECSITHLHKQQNPTLITEREDSHEIARLLRQMVRTVEKQIYRFSERKTVRTSTKTTLESIKHIQKSIKLYKIFFHRFILTYFIDRQQMSTTDLFQSIYSIIHDKSNDDLLTIFHRYQQANQFNVKLNDNVEEYKTTFEGCCKLLIELCSFPKQSSINDLSSASKGKADIEDWLMDLCVLSLCKTGHFSLQTIATSVLIDLFDHTLKGKRSMDTVAWSFSLFLNETNFFQYLIAYLWEYLSEKYNREYNLTAAYLLLILHSMLPNNLCEDLILNQISFGNNQRYSIQVNIIEGYKRFFQLWNSTRDLANITKSFQQCLIHVLSILRESNHGCLKSMVQEWIHDCFIRGDICRIFDILLMMLLQSDTVRVDQELPYDSKNSILMSANCETDDTYEIIFSLTFDDEHNEDYEDENTNDNDLEQEELDEKKRSRTVSNNETTSSTKTIRSSSNAGFSQPIISNLLSFSPLIISRSMRQRVSTMSSSSNKTNHRSKSHISQSLRDNIINDSEDVFTLLYLQSYDYNRVILSFNIIESLIDLLPQQLIHTLLITSNIQTSSISIHNHQMYELFLKHRRIVNCSQENNQEHQSYLYLLLNTLLTFTYTYQKNSAHTEENCQVHIHSLIVLTRICHGLSTICMDNHLLIRYVVHLLEKVSFQKIVLGLFNRIINKKLDLLKLKVLLHDQLLKQYFKQLIQLLEEIILLENVISSNITHQPLVIQPVFLSTILQYFKELYFIENHRYIISLVIKILPHCGSALKTISIRFIEQLCQNLCFISQPETKTNFKQLSSFDTIDYIIHLLQHLSYICNYCLRNPINSTQYFTQTLCSQHWIKRIPPNTTDLSDAHQMILNKLPSILHTLLILWKTLSIDSSNSIGLMNNTTQIREAIVEFLSSLTKSNGVVFIRAVVQYWRARKRSSKDQHNEIHALINILMNINNYSINDMISNMKELIRIQSKKANYILWCLQLLLAYLEAQKNVLIDCWTALAVMLRECFSQSASLSVTFLIIKILNFYIKQSPVLMEKRDLKDLQDITMKVLENCNAIVASSLEQTKWLRKNLQVRLSQPDFESLTTDSSNETDHIPDLKNNTFDFDDNFQSTNSSLIALTILGEYAPKLLDTVYNRADEKDRLVVPYLQNLIANLMPYVRAHAVSNAPAYRAASALLMHISQYSYTKKAWKKEAFEQLFDVSFFQVDLASLCSWKIIVDQMFNNEKAISFRDLMNRINTVQTGLFVSKEQEYEQRAMLIKRFAFVVYASEKNQSNRHSPAIFECLSDLFKLPPVPILHTQMFLFLRVLLVRISSKNLMSFWPTIISELIQVLLQLEQDLSIDAEEDVVLFKSNTQRMSTNDNTSPNASLKMYLYACKLLDVLLAMPYSEMDYFQLFRSAFVAARGTTNTDTTNDTFTSFSIRLARLFEQTSPADHRLMTNNSSYPLLRLRAISNITELSPFFYYLASSASLHFDYEQILLSDQMNEIETSILEDFIESI